MGKKETIQGTSQISVNTELGINKTSNLPKVLQGFTIKCVWLRLADTKAFYNRSSVNGVRIIVSMKL